MIISPTGFYGTGSSAITNLMQEYDNVSCKDDNEIRILHDPDGVSDLEYNLIENPNRHNSSHSIKRFIKQMKKLDHVWFIKRYSKYFDDSFMQIVKNYVNDLTELKYNGAWHYDVYEKGNLFYVVSRIYSKLNAFLRRLLRLPMNGKILISKKEIAYLPTNDEIEFLNKTKLFVNSLAEKLNREKKEYILIDQLVPPSNIQRYVRYIENVKVIVVDRDPRDIYLMEKEVWKGTVVPCDDVASFCKWYRWTRNTAKNDRYDSDFLLHICFEDLIYNYEDTVKKIEAFLNIESKHHIDIHKYFNPEISIQNTQLWNIYGEYEEEMCYIEENLSDYCYDFPNDSRVLTVKRNEIF